MWLFQDIWDSEVHLTGYALFRTCRKQPRRGAVGTPKVGNGVGAHLLGTYADENGLGEAF